MSGETDLAVAEARVRDALARGELREALKLMMEAHGTIVYRFCVHQVRDPELAADARQITFVQAYRDLPRFEGRSSLLTWLLGIAHHRCLDSLRKAERERARTATLEEGHDAVDPTPDVTDRLSRASLVEAVRHCISKLGDKAREAVALRYQEGLSYPQIAEICGDRPATLQARVARALPVLRRCLEAGGVTP